MQYRVAKVPAFTVRRGIAQHSTPTVPILYTQRPAENTSGQQTGFGVGAVNFNFASNLSSTRVGAKQGLNLL